MIRFRKRLAAGVLGAGAIGIAIALYFKTQPISPEHHTEIVDRFGALHTLDAEIAQEALAARYGLAPHYDPLTHSAQQFLDDEIALEHQLARVHQEIVPALGELHEQALLRAAAIERFKTQNSVLKNSLYYLPLAAEQAIDAIDAAARSGAALDPADEISRAQARSELVRAISTLVQVTLTQNLVGGRAEAERVSEQLAQVEGLQPRIPAPALDRYRLLLAHAQTIFRTQQQVDPLLREELLGSPVGAKLSEVERRYGQHFEAALRTAAIYRSILYGWSTLLLLAVLGVGLKLRALYAGMESLVAARTRDLNSALQELWGEMELAKKIQTALVPRQLELRDCDVAAVMRPADQVGGDYYDVFAVDGTEWVLIGDVSGHGVPAGLVMMMCQTAVHAVLASSPNIGPDELLATVNCTLTQNIERLGEDKYMTLSALRRDVDGTFQFAGMHQDLLVYRAQQRRIEQIRCEGAWLGITKNIRGLNPVQRLKLEPGDALVLYTDGITEARRDGQLLDVQGLGRALLEHGNESAEQMLSGILRTLEGYEVRDDVAAVIIKQLEPSRAARGAAA